MIEYSTPARVEMIKLSPGSPSVARLNGLFHDAEKLTFNREQSDSFVADRGKAERRSRQFRNVEGHEIAKSLVQAVVELRLGGSNDQPDTGIQGTGSERAANIGALVARRKYDSAAGRDSGTFERRMAAAIADRETIQETRQILDLPRRAFHIVKAKHRDTQFLEQRGTVLSETA
jgi:hypothetical protein